MFLSIIIPVYNCEKYVAECLDSCLNQDISADDYEIICVNDGSVDKSAEIISGYAVIYGNIKLINKENGGVCSARNLGLEHAKGDYIWFVDADDFLENNIFDKLRTLTVSGLIKKVKFGYYEFTDALTEEEKELKLRNELPPRFSYGETLVTDGLFKKEIILNNHLGFDTDLSHGEDTLFALSYRSLISGEDIRTVTDKPYYYVRRNANSATAADSESKMLQASRSYMHLSYAIKQQFEKCRDDSDSKIILADHYMMALRKCLEQMARMTTKDRRNMKSELRTRGMFPCRQPKECTYTWLECAREPSGAGALRNIFRYYSINPLGLFLASVPYTAERMKVRISRTLRANPAMNVLLDRKNRIIHRG